MLDECSVQHKKKKLNVDTRRNHRFFPLLSERDKQFFKKTQADGALNSVIFTLLTEEIS